MLIDQITTICFIVAGIGIMIGWSNSEYWIVPAILLSIVKAIFDGGALLVEINR